MIRLSKSCIGNREKDAVLGVLQREYLGMGKDVQEFEELLSEFMGRPAVCVNSGTAALHLALQSLGLSTGDEVLVQSLTYVASFQAISATGAVPVACEIDPATITIDLKDAERRLTDRTKVIMPVHYAGGTGALEDMYAFAEMHGLRVVEDAAHAFGTVHNGKRVGGFGDIACFSFDGIKNITSGEGGAVVSDDKILLQKIRDARLLGVMRDTEKRFTGQRSWEFDVQCQGWRYHMSNIMAAIGIEQLKRFHELSSKRQILAKRYNDNLKNLKFLTLLHHDYDSVVPHIFAVKLESQTRDEVRKRMSDRGVETGIHYRPNHLLHLYNPDGTIEMPITEETFHKLLTLPLHPDLSLSDVDYVCHHLAEIMSLP